jgi:hypothetical protein
VIEEKNRRKKRDRGEKRLFFNYCNYFMQILGGLIGYLKTIRRRTFHKWMISWAKMAQRPDWVFRYPLNMIFRIKLSSLQLLCGVGWPGYITPGEQT